MGIGSWKTGSLIPPEPALNYSVKMSSTTMTTTTRVARIKSDTATTTVNQAGRTSILDNSSLSFQNGKSAVMRDAQMTGDVFHSQYIVNVQSAIGFQAQLFRAM